MEKAKEVARAAKVAMEAAEQRSYDLGIQEIEACLTEELVGVCGEYC